MTTTKTVQFKVAINNLEITSGIYQVFGIVRPYVGGATHQENFQGDTFSAEIKENESNYYAVSVLVKSYTLDGSSYTVEDKQINLLATFYLPTADGRVQISPESSISSIYTFARMSTVSEDGLVHMSGTERNMKIAYGMKQNFYRTEGQVADMIKHPPNGFETNSYSMFNSLCNLLYYSLTDDAFYTQFLDYAWHADTPNSSFLGAVRHLLHDPCTNAGNIYQMLVGKTEIYAPSLTSMRVDEDEKAPNNWTLTLKTNTSGARNFLPSGLAFVVFDADDNAWIANNFRAGSNNSGTHCLVYKYDATPADFSPVQGGGLLGVGFGAAIDPEKKHISFGNFGWGPVLNNPEEGSIARFHYQDGTPISPSNGFTPGLTRVQGMEYDKDGNLWMASVGCEDPFAPAPEGVYPFKSQDSAVVVYLDGDPEKMIKRDKFYIKQSADGPISDQPVGTPYLKVFDVCPDNQGNAYVSCIGNYDRNNSDNNVVSAVYKVALEEGDIVLKNYWFSDYQSNNPDKPAGFESLRQVTINGEGDVVVVGVASSRATVLHNDLSGVKGYYDVNTHAPWGVKIDQKQTVFLANFGHESNPRVNKESLDMQGPFGVTMLRKPSQPETAQLLTVPTGGSEVRLANKMPLYGTQTKPVLENGKPTGEEVRMKCYQPIMRLTSTNVDGAGNLWCMNNWKPSAIIDVADNPGGDGAVIFLGIAEPE